MNHQSAHRSTITPVIDTASRPLWSVMIPTYNCAHYLRETLASVLAQAPSTDLMQIAVIDDCSTQDDPHAIVKALGKGRVEFYQQPKNVGHIRNFETCIERSRGKLIHLLHGDDLVRVDFYRKMQAAFEQRPDVGAAFCRHIFMDSRGHWQTLSNLEQSESGILDQWLERIATHQRIQTPSIVVRRDVYEHLGGYDRRIRHWGEDWEMWVRIAANYPVWYEVEPLAIYRMHDSSLTGRSVRTGENIQDFRQAIHIVKDYLPKESANQLFRTALVLIAFSALQTAEQFIDKQDMTAAMNQIREALRCYSSPRMRIAAYKSMIRIWQRSLRSRLAM
ncbi:glycosyltransferase [Cyanobacteria bacterium FACHB-DQ100]|nr:glycosyltransferase [Cyanobacteria bacterium FACHB-DQ100]